MVEAPGLIRLAVFGQPISHSLSPAIHREFAAQFGLAIDYQAIETSAADFPSAVRALAAAGARGCNVTVPFKALALKLARRHSAAAERAGAANTLCFERANDWLAENTDGPGLIRDLGRLGVRVENARVLLLGAGGAAAGVLGALLQASPARVVLLNRTRQKAQHLAGAHADLGAIDAVTQPECATRGPYDLVINATSLGHFGRLPPLERSWLAGDACCYDLNYARAAEPLRRWCEASGTGYSDGMGMLVEQAALSFELWTGNRPETAPVLSRLRAAEAVH